MEAEKPFPRAEELWEKSKRLAELTKLLKMDEKDRELLDSSPDEGRRAARAKSRWSGTVTLTFDNQ